MRTYDRHIDLRVTKAEYETIAALAGVANITVDQWVQGLVNAAIAAAQIGHRTADRAHPSVNDR